MTSAELIPAAVLKRKAVVYVRQSTQSQVLANLEGQRRQYDLVDVARRRGFVMSRSSMTISAARPAERWRVPASIALWPGFAPARLAPCVLRCFRLARNGRDWHHLLELCGLVGARVIDLDGVYDPCRRTTGCSWE